MAQEIVLITGATGHLGFHVLQYALDHGLAVRAAVRSQAKADILKSHITVNNKQKDSRLSFVVVPDFGAPGAFDDAVKAATYIIHCASPIPMSAPTTDSAEMEFIAPAVQATLGILESDSKVESVRRIVITSSCIAVAPVAAAFSDTGETYTANTRQPEIDGPFPPGTPSFVAYAAGKVAALNRAETWIRNENPSFDVIHLMPSYVLGRNGMCDGLERLQTSTNSIPLNIILGQDGNETPMSMVVNHVDDCARIHVEALHPRIEGGQSFMICYDCSTEPKWDRAKEVVAKHFPELIKTGFLKNDGTLKSVHCSLESAKTEEIFGFRHSYDEAVVDIVQQYLELRKKEEENKNRVKD